MAALMVHNDVLPKVEDGVVLQFLHMASIDTQVWHSLPERRRRQWLSRKWPSSRFITQPSSSQRSPHWRALPVASRPPFQMLHQRIPDQRGILPTTPVLAAASTSTPIKTYYTPHSPSSLIRKHFNCHSEHCSKFLILTSLSREIHSLQFSQNWKNSKKNHK